ncbi:hypothetical protein EDD18DRAFT_1468007 [Armillaria luteobubalina]|uniref:F-box domain-containing protein n=1 Tax=Armillaria luteobubalina TaxID=153913 RepID=A0AA39PDV3_9AGAR|nr:hypothetical protein EDD18DRAFT_1468007 [Armillaria luteobubalina]
MSIDQNRPNSVPFGLIHNIRRLTVSQGGPINDIPSLIANNPHLVNLSVTHRLHLDDNLNFVTLSLSSLFSKFPVGQFSKVQVLYLSGSDIVLHPSSIPSLIPHLRHLTDLSIWSFILPAAFWDYLWDANIHLKYLSLYPCEVHPALVQYLSSYTGLRKLYIYFKTPLDNSEYVETRSFWFLPVIQKHALHLTMVDILSSTPGIWCLSEFMIGHLLLCVHLRSISVRVDDISARVKGSKNVVQQLIRCLHIWNFLGFLEIKVVADRSIDPPSGYYRGIPGYVLRNILAAYCLRPTAAMLRLTLHTDLAELRMRKLPLESDKYAFRPQNLTYEGSKAAKEQKKGPMLDGDDEVESIMFKLVSDEAMLT